MFFLYTCMYNLHEALVERKHIQISICADTLYCQWKQWAPPEPKQHLNTFLFICLVNAVDTGTHIAISLALLYKQNTKRYMLQTHYMTDINPLSF